jgi:hypothetical protein
MVTHIRPVDPQIQGDRVVVAAGPADLSSDDGVREKLVAVLAGDDHVARPLGGSITFSVRHVPVLNGAQTTSMERDIIPLEATSASGHPVVS